MNMAALGLMMLLFSGPNPLPGDADDCRTIRNALLAVAREYDYCHVALAKRGNSVAMAGQPPTTPPIQFFDVWMTGESIQVLGVEGEPEASDPWWLGYTPRNAPVTTNDLDSVEGRKVCARPSGDALWADYFILPKKKQTQYPSVYSTSKTIRQVAVLFVPLLELNRRWSEATNQGEWPIVNTVALTPIEKWRLVGRERLDGKLVVKVEVERSAPVEFPLKGRKSPLGFTQIYTCWFSEEYGWQPIRIESSVRYLYNGKDYPYERAAGKEPLIVYEAGDFQKSGDTPWFPMSGSQRAYAPNPEGTAPFDPNHIADELEAKGKFVDNDDYLLNTSREWRVLKLEKIPSTTETWFEPPDGCCIRNMETNTLRIAGLSEEASRKQLMMDAGGVSQPPPSSVRPMRRYLFVAVNVFIICALVLLFVRNRGRNSQHNPEP